MQRSTGREARDEGATLEYRFQNITKTFMHEGITKYRRYYAALIYTYLLYYNDGSRRPLTAVMDKLLNTM